MTLRAIGESPRIATLSLFLLQLCTWLVNSLISHSIIHRVLLTERLQLRLVEKLLAKRAQSPLLLDLLLNEHLALRSVHVHVEAEANGQVNGAAKLLLLLREGKTQDRCAILRATLQRRCLCRSWLAQNFQLLLGRA